MQLSWKRQLILASVLFVGGTFAFWLEYKHKPKEEAQEEQEKKLFNLKDQQVQVMMLTDGHRTFEFDCADLSAKLCKPGDNSKWNVAQPMKVKGDDSSINSLLSAINNLNVTETIELKDETPEKRAALLKEYGLDPEAIAHARRMDVKTPTGETVVYMGLTHPIGESIFAAAERLPAGGKPQGKIDDTKVYLIPNYFKTNWEHELTYWRDKKLLTVGSHEIDAFTLDGTHGRISGDRKDGQWTLHAKADPKGKGPTEDFPGDIENIDNVLSGVTYLSAKEFASENKNDAKAKELLKGHKPLLSFSFTKEKGQAATAPKEAPEPVTLTFYSKPSKDAKAAPGKMYVTVSSNDPLYELDGFVKDRIDKELKDLRLTKLITSMERFGAKRLQFAGEPIGATPITLLNKDGKWLADGKTEVNQDKVQALLDKVSGNRIKEFLAPSAIPSGEDKGLRFTLGDDKTESKRQYLFWKASGKLYARDLNSSRKEAFLIDPSVGDGLPWDRSFFDKSAAKPAPAAPQGTPPAPPQSSLPVPAATPLAPQKK